MEKSSRNILLADSDDEDATLVLEGVRSEGYGGSLHIVHSGDSLIAYLEGAGGSLHSLPDLILMDVRMQRAGGFEALQRIQSDSRWAHIPVVIMGDDLEVENVKAAHRYRAKVFLLKPFSAHDFRRILDLIPHHNPVRGGVEG